METENEIQWCPCDQCREFNCETLTTSFAAVRAEATLTEREAIAAWIEPQRNDVPATGQEFAAAIRARSL